MSKEQGSYEWWHEDLSCGNHLTRADTLNDYRACNPIVAEATKDFKLPLKPKKAPVLDPNEAPDGYIAILAGGKGCKGCCFEELLNTAIGCTNGCYPFDRKDGCSVQFKKKPVIESDWGEWMEYQTEFVQSKGRIRFRKMDGKDGGE